MENEQDDVETGSDAVGTDKEGKEGGRPEQLHIALIKLRGKNGAEVPGWIVEKNKSTFQTKLGDERIVNVVKIFKGRELPFEFKSVPVF